MPPESTKTFYDTLGVSPTADPDDIQRIYRRLSKLYHPDVNPDPAAAEKLKDINEAYDTVGDERKRRAYDAELRLGTTQSRPPDPGRAEPAVDVDALLNEQAQLLRRQWEAVQHELGRQRLAEQASQHSWSDPGAGPPAAEQISDRQYRKIVWRRQTQRYTGAAVLGLCYYLLRTFDLLSPLGTTVITEKIVECLSGFNWILALLFAAAAVLVERYSGIGARLIGVRSDVVRCTTTALLITVLMLGEYLSTSGGLAALAAGTAGFTLLTLGAVRFGFRVHQWLSRITGRRRLPV